MSLSPMMKQYHEAKQVAGDALLLFRMGDFYELFFEDAKSAANLLGLSLTSRDKGENPIPMAGFPHHQLDQYLGKIIAAGLRAAVCEQVEDPRTAKGLVKRDVTRIVSRGTVTDDSLLEPYEPNFLLAVAAPACAASGTEASACGLAWLDLSTGQFEATVVAQAKLGDELSRISPVELLLSEDAAPLPAAWTEGRQTTRRSRWAFSHETAAAALTKQFGAKTLEGFGFTDDDAPAVAAAGAVLDYVQETQKSALAHINHLLPYRPSTRLEIDESTRRSLEITRTLREGRREGSLRGVMDRTVTSMGARLLGDWLASPLIDVSSINARLDAVDELLADASLASDLRESLRSIYDVPRLLARVASGRASPRDLSFVARTMRLLPKIKARLTDRGSARLQRLESRIDLCGDIRRQLDAALEEDCPLTSREGGFIRRGFDAKLDEQRELAKGGKRWIAEYQAAAVERTGIPSMKVGFNRVFGYYLEVTHAHRDKVPEEFIRKQTLKNAERYVTPELKQHEEKVLAAEEHAKQLEYDRFIELREKVALATRRLHSTAAALAEIDVLASLAELARTRNYVRPTITDAPTLDVTAGRHPVLDMTEPEGTFVPNDLRCGIGDSESTILLITGPNMAGKSTYIRQAALLTLMAQMGSFIPAQQAVIGVADRIFARVGASDDLARGRSTFMVEMTETARILNTATNRSLVVLDEIGRGTSTYDGLALACAVVEHLHDAIGCRTLFATHYHELTELAERLGGVTNLNVAVKEWMDDVVFLHQIVDGAADKSYGIHVAQLAGVPPAVNRRAAEILTTLESGSSGQQDAVEKTADRQRDASLANRPREQSSRIDAPHSRSNGRMQLTLFEMADHPVLDALRQLNADEMTPLEALQFVASWKVRLEKEAAESTKADH